jgi:hypothetical protein
MCMAHKAGRLYDELTAIPVAAPECLQNHCQLPSGGPIIKADAAKAESESWRLACLRAALFEHSAIGFTFRADS